MDDIVYVPLRRLFVRPLSAMYSSKYSTNAQIIDEVTKYSFKDAINQFSQEGKEVLVEMRPRGVTRDNVKDFIQDQDFKTREQHYFEYIRNRKANLPDSESEPPQFQKHSPEDYKRLQNTTFSDIFRTYHTGYRQEPMEYKDFNDVMDMMKIVKKPQRKLSDKSLTNESSNTLKDLVDLKGGNADSFADQLIEQSQKYQPLDNRTERRRQLEEMQKLQKRSLETDKKVKPEEVIETLENYKGDLTVRPVQKGEIERLKNLKREARKTTDYQSDSTNKTQSNTQPTQQETEKQVIQAKDEQRYQIINDGNIVVDEDKSSVKTSEK